MSPWLDRWLARHRHPVSRILHALGIPLIPAAALVAMAQLHQGAWSQWWRPVMLLAFSYLLQWIGHRVEGNEMGEVILVKKALGRPYVAISPRYPTGERADAQSARH
jgi:hypothetical protein